MKKILFAYCDGYKQIFEFKDDATEEEIENEFQTWVWTMIDDGAYWRPATEKDIAEMEVIE
jgi:hypothetical protein